MTKITREVQDLVRALSGYYHLGINNRELDDVSKHARVLLEKYGVLHKAREVAKNEWD